MENADPLVLVLPAYLVMAVIMAGLWAVQLRWRNASLADVGWCGGLVAVVLWYTTQAPGDAERKFLVGILVTVYAGRLGLHILLDRVVGKLEDARYRRLRGHWGPSASWFLFGYFQLQALAVAAFSLPFLVVIQNPRPPFGFFELAGVLVWTTAVSGEALADWQLARFRAKPWNRDRVCREGLWLYSRHPNYFFEWLHWWSYVVMALGAPGWPLTWIGPVVMGWALVKVTGIPLAEAQALVSRGEDYRHYQRTTSRFIPWPPRDKRLRRTTAGCFVARASSPPMTGRDNPSKQTAVTRTVNMVLTTIAVLGLLVAALLLLARLLGLPSQGEQLVWALGIPRPAIIAHRGASYLAPEETRPAFLLARELGATYLEFDVQRTKDGVLIALHDDNLSRTTNVSVVFPGREQDTIDTFTFAELRQLDAGSWFNYRFPARARASFNGLQILRIEEILEIAETGSRRPGLYIETKAPGRFPGMERQLVEILTRRGWIQNGVSQGGERLIFQSFEPDSLARLKTLAPAVPRLLLIDEVMAARQSWQGLLDQAVRNGHGIGPWGVRWAFGPRWSLIDAPRRYVATWPWYTGQAHRAGLFVHAWTIDHRWEMWMVSLGGSDGIFTNRTELALEVYGKGTPELDGLWKRIGYE